MRYAPGHLRRMSVPLGLPHPQRRNPEAVAELRETQRFLDENVRNDWDYQPLPRFQLPLRRKEDGSTSTEDRGDDVDLPAGATAAGENVKADAEEAERNTQEDRIAGFRFYRQSNHDRETLLHRAPEALGFEPAGWREREYSSEEMSDETDVADRSGGKTQKKEFKFDNPDSVGEQLSDRTLARKRKRQKRLDEEGTWNDGLAHWLARRDVWCGAHTSAQVQALKKPPAHDEPAHSASESASTHSSTHSAADSSETDVESSQTPSTTPDLPSEVSSSEPPIIPTVPSAPPSEILIPLVPTILADHPIRKRIDVDVYPEIYSKIILQSRSPSVPINLLSMTRAMVQGWKADGEWPPESSDAVVAKKHHGPEWAIKSGVRAVGRALRLSGDHSHSSPKS